MSDSSYTVWVNGVPASVTGTSWQADGVPVPPGGTTSFTVIASPPPPASSVNLKTSVDQPDRLYVETDEQARTYTWHQRDDYYNVAATEVDWADTSSSEVSGHHWADGPGGSRSYTLVVASRSTRQAKRTITSAPSVRIARTLASAGPTSAKSLIYTVRGGSRFIVESQCCQNCLSAPLFPSPPVYVLGL